jgi:hypothetical protein
MFTRRTIPAAMIAIAAITAPVKAGDWRDAASNAIATAKPAEPPDLGITESAFLKDMRANHAVSAVDFDGGAGVYIVNNCVFIDSKIDPQTKRLVAVNVYAYTDGTDIYCKLDDLHEKGMLLEEVAADAVRAIVGDPEGSTTHAMLELLKPVFEGSTRDNVQIHNGGRAERKIGGHTVKFQIADNGMQFSISPSP